MELQLSRPCRGVGLDGWSKVVGLLRLAARPSRRAGAPEWDALRLAHGTSIRQSGELGTLSTCLTTCGQLAYSPREVILMLGSGAFILKSQLAPSTDTTDHVVSALVFFGLVVWLAALAFVPDEVTRYLRSRRKESRREQ